MTETVNVLLVEDEPDLADLYAGWLEAEYHVTTAYNGEEALDHLESSIDVVFLDRRMPGISGDDVLKIIRELDIGCRVAMLTAIEPDFDIIDMGFDDYLIKPVEHADLRETVRRLHSRSEYNKKVEEYASLVSKMTALETEKSATELESNLAYQQLSERVEELRQRVDPMVEDFEEEDFAAVLRDIPAKP